jgi:hypothetical protein
MGKIMEILNEFIELKSHYSIHGLSQEEEKHDEVG